MAVAAALAAPVGFAGEVQQVPPAAFKEVSALTQLPDYIPGLGTLYLNPATALVGPYLGYDKSGKIINVIYMVPLHQLQERKGFENLGAAVSGLKVDHIEVTFNPGHPGMMEPHYHVTEWLIQKSAQDKLP